MSEGKTIMFYLRIVLTKFCRFASKLKTLYKKEIRPRNDSIFLEKNGGWLDVPFLEEYLEMIGHQPSGPGRPVTPFSELSDRQKRRRTIDIRQSISPDKLKHAAKTVKYTEGNIMFNPL